MKEIRIVYPNLLAIFHPYHKRNSERKSSTLEMHKKGIRRKSRKEMQNMVAGIGRLMRIDRITCSVTPSISQESLFVYKYFFLIGL